MNTIRRSLAFSMADKYVSQILLIATTAAMARILTPAETGLYMTANAVIMLADNFRTFGVGVYIIQEQHLDKALVRSAFTVTLVLSLVIGSLIYLSSGSIAAFYAAPDLRTLLALSALGFLFVPFSSPIMALLQRDMAFRAVACINMAAAFTGSAITVTLGLRGFGPVSYIWGFVGTSFVMASLAFASRPHGWIFVPCFDGTRKLLSFGIVSSMITVINMVYDLLPRLAFGKILGFDAVGLYARAINVCQLPDRAIVSVLNPVVLPAFAAQARAGGSLKQSYLHGLALMLSIQWPALILLSLLANPIVHLLLGPQWGAVPPLVRMMALANLALAPAALTFPVLVSAGRIGDALRASLISLPPSAAIIIGAAFFSLDAVAASLLLVAPFQMLVALFFIRRTIGLNASELALTLRGNALLALGCALVPVLVVATSPTGFDLSWTRALLALGGAAAGWLTVLVAVDHPAKREIATAATFLLDRLLPERLGKSGPQPTSRRIRS